MKIDWKNFQKNARLLKKNYKNTKQVAELLSNFPENGYMRDNISKNFIEIKSAKSSSLRRYVSLLTNFYYLLNTEKDKDLILKKKKEIEEELNKRGE